MKILLQAMRLHDGPHRQLSGNFYHVLHLAEALHKYKDINLKILVDNVTYPEFKKSFSRDNLMHYDISGNHITEVEAKTCRAVDLLKPDIYHRPTGQLPFRRFRCKTIAGVADLNFRILPTPLLKRAYKLWKEIHGFEK